LLGLLARSIENDNVAMDCPDSRLQFPAIFRLPPELRRSCWYVVVGVLVIGGTCVLLFVKWPVIRPNVGLADVVAQVVVALAVAAVSCLPLRWRLRLGSDGVSQRWIRWQTWSWEDVAAGRIKKTPSGNLSDPDRPWWRRTIFLSMLSSDDFRIVSDAINEHYRLPAQLPQPESLRFQYGFRRTAVFDPTGIHLTINGVAHDYAWDELVDAHIMRLDPLRRDFQRLELTLPDQRIELFFTSHHGRTYPSFRGATAEQIDEALRLHAAEDKITATIRGDPLVKPLHVERALTRTRKQQRELRHMMFVFVPLAVVSAAMMVLEKRILGAIFCLGSFTPFVAVLGSLHVRNNRKIVELENRLEHLRLEHEIAR
jgi:hypothetical protein